MSYTRVVSDEQRLLDAIVATPDDDAPRLVYADVLQGRGDPRGELIQLQCQLAAAPDDDRRRKIKIAENKLLAAHGETWLQPLHDRLPAPLFPDAHRFELVRGFVEKATITLACLPHLDALFTLAPLLRELRITPNGFVGSRIDQPRLDGALASPRFERITSLELALPGAGNTLVREVADAPALRALRELHISGLASGELAGFFNAPPEKLIIDDVGAAELALSPHLAGLERLHLESNRLTLEGVRALGTGRWRLRELDLAGNALEPDGIAFALGGPAFRELEILRLASNAIPRRPRPPPSPPARPSRACASSISRAVTSAGSAPRRSARRSRCPHCAGSGLSATRSAMPVRSRSRGARRCTRSHPSRRGTTGWDRRAPPRSPPRRTSRTSSASSSTSRAGSPRPHSCSLTRPRSRGRRSISRASSSRVH